MKKLLLISAFSAAVFSGVDAQTLDGQWTDGIVTYYAKKNVSDYLFDGFLGEDRSFTISKTAQNKFVIKKESEEEYYSLGKNGSTVLDFFLSQILASLR